MIEDRRFEELVSEGAAVPTQGWDFSWFVGRATEERPPWGYARLIGERMRHVRSALDIQTGGGEVLATIPEAPPILAATESWPPNLVIARRNLRHLGATVVPADEAGPLPFEAEAFELVVSRHPTVTPWREIARVLKEDGRFLSQQVGAGTMHELTEAMLGPRHIGPDRSPATAVAAAKAAGLTVVDLREATLRVEFFDVAAVVHFLRKVIWTVPEFTVDAYREQLYAIHRTIRSTGAFVGHSKRFLIEVSKDSGKERPSPRAR